MMEQDKWTQQLHDKLAEHETAAPEGLWTDIEAAIGRQSEKREVRLFPRIRWAAASLALLVMAGAYWWMAISQDSNPSVATVSTPNSGQNEPTVAVEHRQEVPLGKQAEEKTVFTEKNTSAHPSVTRTGLADKEPSEEVRSGDDLMAAGSSIPQESLTQKQPQPQSQTSAPTPAGPVIPRRQQLSLSKKSANAKSNLHLSLYAMNSLSAHKSSNQVQMSNAMAKQFDGVYAYNLMARKVGSPIYLTGYEEQQKHYQPVAIGLTLHYPVSRHLAITSGLVYTKLSADFTKVMQSMHITQQQTLHYVGIPLSMNYRCWKSGAFTTYISAGGQMDWNVKTHLVTEGAEQTMEKDRLQWSLGGSLGAQYDIIPQIGIYVEPGVRHYFDNGSSVQTFFKDKPTNFNLQVGVRVNMK